MLGQRRDDWTPEDWSVLVRHRRALAAAANAERRGLPGSGIGAHIATAFPDLCDPAEAAAGSVLPLKGLEGLSEAGRRALLSDALRQFLRTNASLSSRDGWTDRDLDRFLAMPQVLAAIDACRRFEYGGPQEFWLRAFPDVYPGGESLILVPVAGLDDLSPAATSALLSAAFGLVAEGKVALPTDLEARFPSAYVDRSEIL